MRPHEQGPASPYRGAGAPEACFARERLIDIAARELGVDRAELRRRNLVRPEQMPFDTGLASVEAAVILDSGDFPAALDQALAMVDYPAFAEKQEAARAEGRLIGLGICVYHQTSGTGPFEGASVRVDPSGQVTVNAGSAPQGQGTGTMLAQIVADELQIDHETVKCVFGDTGRIAFGIGTFASRNAVMAGTSVQMASIKVRDKALQLAGHLLEVDAADLEFVDGAFQVKGSPQPGGPSRSWRRPPRRAAADLRAWSPISNRCSTSKAPRRPTRSASTSPKSRSIPTRGRPRSPATPWSTTRA